MAQDNFEIRGEVTAHGKAPFAHKEGNSDSYFVTTKSKEGKEHTQWGTDLARAVKVADVQIGDKIHLKQTESKSFERKDENGQKVEGKKVSYDVAVTEKAAKGFEIRGELVAHGKAPFAHKEGNTDSYYVTTKSKEGKEHTQWGTDLERAVKVADAQIGDKIHLQHGGARSFEMKVPELDKEGNKVGESTAQAKKITYQLNITEKASEKNNPHLTALKAIPELSNVSKGDMAKLASLRQVAEENTTGKAKLANTLAKFDAAVKNPEFRESALKQITQEKSENSASKNQQNEAQLSH